MAHGNVIFSEGFDKYFALGTAESGATLALLMAGQWDTLAGTYSYSFDSPLGGNGLSLFTSGGSNGSFVATKNLATAYTVFVGGLKFTNNLVAAGDIVTFFDPSGNQCGAIGINTNGTIYVKSGTTLSATSTAFIGPNQINQIEWKFAISDTGAYNVYLNKVSILSGTADFKPSTTASYKQFRIQMPGGLGLSPQMHFDHLYIMDDSGDPFLTNPIIESSPVTGDSAVQFASGLVAFGAWSAQTINTNAPGANQLFLRRFQAPASGTLSQIVARAAATSSTAKSKAVIYADSSGAVGSLIASGDEIVGTTSGSPLVGTFTTSPPALTGSTFYWIGFITDTSVALSESDTSTTGAKVAATYTSGAPASPTGFTLTNANWALFATMTGVTGNYLALKPFPTPGYLGDFCYVADATVGDEDLFTFQALLSSPLNIHCVAYKALMKSSDGGARTVEMHCKSNTTDSAGSVAAGTPLLTNKWFETYLMTDPNTSTDWSGAAAVNAAKGGYKIAS